MFGPGNLRINKPPEFLIESLIGYEVSLSKRISRDEKAP
jgi:hypothetical protein